MSQHSHIIHQIKARNTPAVFSDPLHFLPQKAYRKETRLCFSCPCPSLAHGLERSDGTSMDTAMSSLSWEPGQGVWRQTRCSMRSHPNQLCPENAQFPGQFLSVPLQAKCSHSTLVNSAPKSLEQLFLFSKVSLTVFLAELSHQATTSCKLYPSVPIYPPLHSWQRSFTASFLQHLPLLL